MILSYHLTEYTCTYYFIVDCLHSDTLYKTAFYLTYTNLVVT